MGLFENLFKSKQKPEETVAIQAIDKSRVAVYPMIKSGESPVMPYAYATPFVTINDKPELSIIYAQDAVDRFEYLKPVDLENPDIKHVYDNWQKNIDEYPFELEVSEHLKGRVIFASGDDHSSEKILSSSFLSQACEVLKTDKLILSLPRRRCLMITSYHEDFNLLETFFQIHFKAWREEDYGNEVITEMVFIADEHKVTYAVPLGFRIQLYEKDGQTLLNYSTMDELFDEGGKINFQQIIEKNKIPVNLI